LCLRANIQKDRFGGDIRAILKDPNDSLMATNVKAICSWLGHYENCILKSQIRKCHCHRPGSTGCSDRGDSIVKKRSDRSSRIQSVKLSPRVLGKAEQSR